MEIINFVRRWWRMIALLVCGGLFTINAYAGTYNFYFSDKNKKHKEEAVETDAENESDEQESKQPASNDPVKTAASQQPIIINNVNNNDNTNKNVVGQPVPQSTGPSAVPAVASVSPAAPEPPSFSEAVVERPSRPNKFRFRLAGGHMNQKVDRYVGTIGFGVQIAKTFAIDAYGGGLMGSNMNQKIQPYAGIDLTWTPFRLSFTESWDILQVGFVLGGTTLQARSDNVGTLHGGFAANLSLGPNFSLFSTLKANLAYVGIEGGIVTRF